MVLIQTVFNLLIVFASVEIVNSIPIAKRVNIIFIYNLLDIKIGKMNAWGIK
jgi:hypothetical protein